MQEKDGQRENEHIERERVMEGEDNGGISSEREGERG